MFLAFLFLGFILWYMVMIEKDYRKKLMLFYELLSKEEFSERQTFVRLAKEVGPLRKKVLSKKYTLK